MLINFITKEIISKLLLVLYLSNLRSLDGIRDGTKIKFWLLLKPESNTRDFSGSVWVRAGFLKRKKPLHVVEDVQSFLRHVICFRGPNKSNWIRIWRVFSLWEETCVTHCLDVKAWIFITKHGHSLHTCLTIEKITCTMKHKSYLRIVCKGRVSGFR